ncbi:M20/M25/M40 family metallo-hydrolase [Spongiactinospora sp. TRM90649]|uniref:M20/M25/M40 family metallo-hydrolase n=1 Tax=Spongiactinospora sp. TRM90649 TaxID=3031114 RepID=UPI0023F8F699|nr:M20/M25/M40 family metallo-hydrolase [Spongiactinospora sp. TRM90649]MDF5757315.1 M20/M25/M40 family metallo-hydrolase [Spongiactinospora sp. TRM90649]
MITTDLRTRIAGLMPQARDELAELVAIRSVADPRRFPPEEGARAARWVRGKFSELGFTDTFLAETADGSQAVIGSRECSAPAAPTVLLYAHYDVQPPLDEAAWLTPPFRLTEVNGRWYGRGTADCKGNILVHLTALRALGAEVPVNLKLVIEGSEEQGTGGPWPPERFRGDAEVLDGVSLLGDGSVADMLWARPAVTILGIDCPPVQGSAAAITPRAAARLNLRIPPGMTAERARIALTEHLHAIAPWGVRATVETEATGEAFRAATDGPAHRAIGAAMREAYGTPMTLLGQGGSIPLCNVLADTYPDAELILMGVEEPQALIHAPNESVDPNEIAAMALTEALFLRNYASARM